MPEKENCLFANRPFGQNYRSKKGPPTLNVDQPNVPANVAR